MKRNLHNNKDLTEKARWREHKSIQSARQPGKSEMAGTYERPKCPSAGKKRDGGNIRASKVPVSPKKARWQEHTRTQNAPHPGKSVLTGTKAPPKCPSAPSSITIHPSTQYKKPTPYSILQGSPSHRAPQNIAAPIF